MKMDSKKRVRVSQIMAQLKLALIEETASSQLECIRYAKKTLDLIEFDLTTEASKELPKKAP